MAERIRRCEARDFEQIWNIIDDGAQAYRGAIPADCRHEPYMSAEELAGEIGDGVTFYGYEEEGILLGVMGLQEMREVSLIRHAYVRTGCQKQGIGSRLLRHLETLAESPILIGTWADAGWAIRFYEKHGYRRVDPQEKDRLLRRYWTISARQIETSVVLADRRWFDWNAQDTDL